jgi:hypothetical protein
MCADLGHVLINWAGAEQSLDMCVTIVFQNLPDSKRFEATLPKALHRKTGFMLKSFQNIGALKDMSDIGIVTMNQLNKLARERNDMIHAALGSTMSINGKWRFLKFDYGSVIHTVRPVEYSQSDFQEAGKEMMALAGEVELLLTRLRKFYLPSTR